MKKVYLAGRFSKYDNWKEKIKKVDDFEFFDPEINSNQSSPDTFFPDDLKAVRSSDILIANPGLEPCEGTWIEVGYFLAHKTKISGDFCKELIIIWEKERINQSLDFVKKTGVIVSSVDEAVKHLKKLINNS